MAWQKGSCWRQRRAAVRRHSAARLAGDLIRQPASERWVASAAATPQFAIFARKTAALPRKAAGESVPRPGRLAAMLLPLLCAACMVGPDYRTPPVAVAANYLEAGNPSVQTRREEYRDWWTVFDDPVLNRLIGIAYNQNLTLVAAGTRVLQARAELGVAIGDFYPQSQQATSALIYDRPSHADPTATPQSQVSGFWRASFGASLDWELDFWGKFRRAIQSADAAYLESIASYDDALVTLLGDVATTYIGIRTLQTQIDIAQDNIVKQKKALAIAEARFHGGVATKLDVYQAENVLGQTESTVPQLTAQLDQGLDALARAAGDGAAAARQSAARTGDDPGAARRRYHSASRPTWCAADPISAPPSWRRWRKVLRSASPKRSSIRRSACSAVSARFPAISPAISSAIW